MTTPTPLTYNAYVTQVANLAVQQTTTTSGVVQGVDAQFNVLIPQMLNYAELRIQRDLDLLPSLTSGNYTLTQGSNILQIPVGDFVTIQTIGVSLSGGAVTPLLPAAKEYIQTVWGIGSTSGQPRVFAMVGGDSATGGNTSNNIMLGPVPASAYTATVYGTARLPTLNTYANQAQAGTSTTFISTWLPDLLIQASMIYVSQYQRNFGASSNDPQMGPTYELQYKNLLTGAQAEEGRKKFQSSGWTSLSQPVGATSDRG